ncbi:MAG: hypothetical protein AAGF79_03610 [Pseudomonadota bacterium]
MRNLKKLFGFSGTLVILAGQSLACAFHGYAPRLTLVDRMISGDLAVVARPAGHDPFQFEQVSHLYGQAAAPPIPHLVDSMSRRKLARIPQDTVLFVYGASDGWQRVAYLDAALTPVVNRVITELPGWTNGEDRARATFFAGLLGHPDTDVHHLALRELDRVSYAELAALPLDIDPNRLTAPMNNLSQADLKPIRLLLLGLSGVEGAAPLLKAGVSRHLANPGPLLGAYTTAYIEAAGVDAVDWVVASGLQDRSLPRTTRVMILEALSMHMQAGSPALKSAIRQGLQQASRGDVELALLAAVLLAPARTDALPSAIPESNLTIEPVKTLPAVPPAKTSLPRQ